jgi:hypothetical protein
MARSSDPIPRQLSKAFHDAVSLFPIWSVALAEREVTIKGRPYTMSYTMSQVCRLVAGFSDPLPHGVFDELLSHMHAIGDKFELSRKPSYATAARCLLKLIENRKAAYLRREKMRRNKGGFTGP